MLIRKTADPLTGQQVDAVTILIQFIDHRIHQHAAAAY